MEKFQYLDLVVFHTPMNDQEKKEIYLVVDEEADDEFDRMDVMEIHQKIPFPCINTFKKSYFKLFHRPTEEEKSKIQKEKKYTFIKAR